MHLNREAMDGSNSLLRRLLALGMFKPMGLETLLRPKSRDLRLGEPMQLRTHWSFRALIAAGPVTVLFFVVGVHLPSWAQQQPDYISITEIDYDQPGGDTAEWIELHNGFGVEFQADDAFLVFYDADSTGTCLEYCRVDLSSLWFIASNAYIVIGNHPCAVLPLCTTTDAIQNGAPDAIAIEQGGNIILWSLEYEFDLVSSVCSLTPVFPQHSSPLQTAAADSDSLAGSIHLCDGAWIFTPTSTPCAMNACATSSVPEFIEHKPWGQVKTLYKE